MPDELLSAASVFEKSDYAAHDVIARSLVPGSLISAGHRGFALLFDTVRVVKAHAIAKQRSRHPRVMPVDVSKTQHRAIVIYPQSGIGDVYPNVVLQRDVYRRSYVTDSPINFRGEAERYANGALVTDIGAAVTDQLTRGSSGRSASTA